MRSGGPIDSLSSQPWLDYDIRLPSSLPSMISPEEQAYLYWLGRDAWTGRGEALEIGPWLGGSTWCLAGGMMENPRRDPASRLHVVDTFRWREFMSQRAPLPLAPGESFRERFERNVADRRNVLVVHEAVLPEDSTGDIQFTTPQRAHEEQLPIFSGEELDGEITVAFVDGAKSWRSIAHLFRLLSPRVVPGETLLVLQDFQDWGSYWIPMAAMRVLELCPGSLELVHVLRQNTVAFRIQTPLPFEHDRLEESIDEISVPRGLALIGKAEEMLERRVGRLAGSTVSLTAVSFLAAHGHHAQAIRRFREIEARWPWRGGRAPLERVRGWLEERAGHPLPRSARTTTAELLRIAAAKVRGLRPAIRLTQRP